MRECEDIHWWYRSLHRYLLRLLRDLNGSGKCALDVGCGTGGLMARLADRGYSVAGFDLSAEAVQFARQRGFSDVQVGDANRFPVADASFDLVTCVNVLECREVEPERVMAEIARCLRPGGLALVHVPAFNWLRSQHDIAIHSVRRFTRRELACLVGSADLRVVRATYLFAMLFPLLATWKLLHPVRGECAEQDAVSDVALPLRVVNEFLSAVCVFESCLLPWVPFPLGTSVCVLAQRR